MKVGGTGVGVLTLVKLDSNTSIKQHLVLAEIHLDFDSWSWLQIFGGGHGFMLVSCRSPCKFSDFTWFDIVFVHRPLLKHWKSTKRLRRSTWVGIKLARKEPRPGAWHGGLWLQASKRWNKMESGGVPVVFATCQSFVLLDGCWGVQVLGLCIFPKESLKWNGNKMKVGGTGVGVLTLVKLDSNTSIKQYLVLAEIHLDFDSWSWLQIFGGGHGFMLVSCRSPCKFSDFTWFVIVFVHRPLLKHWKSTKRLRRRTWDSMKLAKKEQMPGAWNWGPWLQASKRWNKMESSGVPVVFETCEILVLLDRCRVCVSFQKRHWNEMETRWKWEGQWLCQRCKRKPQFFCWLCSYVMTCPWASFSSNVFEAKLTFSFGFPRCTGLVFSNMNVQEMHRPFTHATLLRPRPALSIFSCTHGRNPKSVRFSSSRS